MAYVYRRPFVRRPTRKLIFPLPPILAASAGVYSLSGVAAQLAGPASAGVYVITGGVAGEAVTLTANTGAYAATGSAAAFVPLLSAGTGSYGILGQAAFKSNFVVSAGSYAVTGITAPDVVSLLAVSGSYTIAGGGNLAPLVMRADAGAYALTLGDFVLTRTGGEYDQVYGGIGHYLEELERQRQLAKITRPTPAPIVREVRAHFKPLTFPQPAAQAQAHPPAPVVDFQAIAAQRKASQLAQQQAAQQAAIATRRRREAELLLLVC